MLVFEHSEGGLGVVGWWIVKKGTKYDFQCVSRSSLVIDDENRWFPRRVRLMTECPFRVLPGALQTVTAIKTQNVYRLNSL